MDVPESRKAANDPKADGLLSLVERWTGPLATAAILVACGFALWAFSVLAFADLLTGRVVGVTDGDTITVLDLNKRQHKVRLAGIDAPERKQAFGNRAKQHLSYLVYSKPVSVEYTKRDRYKRLIGKVWVASGDACPSASPSCPKTLDTGLAMLTVGLAWHYKKYEMKQSEEDRFRYAFAEEEARAKKVGLWGDTSLVPPWEFRSNRIKASRGNKKPAVAGERGPSRQDF